MAYGTGFIPRSIEHFIVLEWDITRGYRNLTLPINYQEYHDLLLVPMNGSNEWDFILPTAVLANGLTAYGSNQNNRISFDPTTRTFTRVGNTDARRIDRYVYAELRL